MEVFKSKTAPLVIELPTIAQLVERPTVEVTQLSGGPWFESGLSELFYPAFTLERDPSMSLKIDELTVMKLQINSSQITNKQIKIYTKI